MKKTKKIFMIAILIISITLIVVNIKSRTINNQTKETNLKNSSKKFIYSRSDTASSVQMKEYQTMPSDLKGHKVIGKLQIPAINLETYILENTNKETLNISVTKLTGPEINQIGNFCITGHNYINSKMFWKLNKVKINDEIILTDTYDKSLRYKVYEKKEIEPKQIEALNQDTKEEKEVTLITCTFGASKRLIVKASEIYD